MKTKPKYDSLGGLARRAGVTRPVVSRLVAQKSIAPAAFLIFGEVQQPLFVPDQALDVIQAVRPLRHLPLVIGDAITKAL